MSGVSYSQGTGRIRNHNVSNSKIVFVICWLSEDCRGFAEDCRPRKQ